MSFAEEGIFRFRLALCSPEFVKSWKLIGGYDTPFYVRLLSFGHGQESFELDLWQSRIVCLSRVSAIA